ncbi:hypothetical protein ILP92_09715 [Maribius pontilimi]|uniref:Uncharacterized protein n=1 Tax=Palleronia pontilimi TaxID=1964209 RepID=A0A934IJD8_9RHOB|nr:hypothetical protein [Palleronia pontilimi]MBJ3763019.1 hypothetical protein [Palleronia pontilimi]
MQKQISAHPEGGAQLRIKSASKKIPLHRLAFALAIGAASMIAARAAFIRVEPLLGTDMPTLSWAVLLLGDLGLAGIAAVLAMIALRLDKPALQGAMAVGVGAMFLGDAHMATLFPEAFATLYTDTYANRVMLEHGPILAAFAN